MPVKERAFEHEVEQQQKKKPTFVHINKGNNFFLGSNTLDGTDDNRKLVNVSIDLINENGQGSEEDEDGIPSNMIYQGG